MAEVLNPYSLLLTEEQRIIMKTRRLRENMVDGFIKDNNGLPTKGSEIRVINEVLNSLDDQVLGLVDKRLKHEESSSNNALNDTIKEVFLQVESIKKDGKIINPDVTNRFIPDDVVDGEDSTDYIELEISDILGDE